jgi:hypothetical protein
MGDIEMNRNFYFYNDEFNERILLVAMEQNEDMEPFFHKMKDPSPQLTLAWCKKTLNFLIMEKCLEQAKKELPKHMVVYLENRGNMERSLAHSSSSHHMLDDNNAMI